MTSMTHSGLASGMVVIGCSLGGLEALGRVLRGLRVGFEWPVAVVQHRAPSDETDSMGRLLQQQCALPIVEAEDKAPIRPGRVYLAPPDYHLMIEQRAHFALSTDDRVCSARPAIDVLFQSAAESFAEHTVGVVLTGASKDGCEGAARIKERGGRIVVQNPATAESPLMPRSVKERVQVDAVLALEQIAGWLERAATARAA